MILPKKNTNSTKKNNTSQNAALNNDPKNPPPTRPPIPLPKTPSHLPVPSPTPTHPPRQPTQIQSLGKTTSNRHLKIRSPPTFTNPLDERLYRKQHLAAAFRVFAARGFDEGVAGHISVRDPLLPSHFWLNPLSAHFALIRVSDLILVDDTGLVVQGNEPVNTAAFTIHAAIHRARPDVHAACHAHSVYGKAFSVFGRELEMLTQDSLRFYKSHGVYRHFGGVVVDREEGERIAAALGEGGKAVILQNHGILTVGQSVDEAAFWFMSLERSCQAQLLADAAAAGGYEKKVIGDEQAAFSSAEVGGPEKGWLAFQPYYDEILKKTGGEFLE
ncbi:class II aldolase/adducin domain protein [Bombardia bombarda]|uniref:Class II aldolase/adducin domain protein n=1 Tax=Bombardia bombarda TaxID=252184 RepID=A0AA39TJP3_9PEZI|nr:class II aldolase/adducin domain protein [Bombardia bombarda]